MQIYNNMPSEVLWKLFKDSSFDIPIFVENFISTKEPKTYIILRTNVYDAGENYGDGQVVTRSSDCDIQIISQGNDNAELLSVIAKIKTILRNNDIDFSCVNLGFDGRCQQYVISLSVRYYG